MARLTINSYEGEKFNIWFNDEITGKKSFDASEWSDSYGSVYQQSGYTKDQLTNAWSIGTKRIRFELTVPYTTDNNGQSTTEHIPIFAEWAGRFKVKGDKILEGKVTSFSRDWGKSYGNIKITEIRYSLKKEMGSFWSLTIPKEIASHFEGTIGEAMVDQYGNIANTVISYVSSFPPGSTYDFTTSYG